MKLILQSITAMVACLSITGCVITHDPLPSPPPQPKPQPQPVPQQVTTPVTPLQGNEALHTTTELPSTVTTIQQTIEDKPRVSFAYLASDAQEAEFCRKVSDQCKQRLLPQSARIVPEGKADMTVVFDVEFKDKKAFGEYALVECKEFRARIVNIREEELSSIMVVRPAPMPRKLGRDEALNQYIEPVCAELLPRLSDEINRLANENIRVEEVTFLVKCAPSKNVTDEFRREIQRIKGILDDEKGILNWELVSQDAETQRCRVRIVYKKGSFREGLGNKLGLK